MSHVELDLGGRVATIRLDRPEKHNAITPDMLDLITELCDEVGRSGADVMVLAGTGPDFSVGFDLEEFLAGTTTRGAHSGAAAVDALLDLELITVARLTGWVVGGGAALAAACDLRVGDATTVIRIPEVPLGIPLGWGAIPLLVTELGPSVTKDLVMTGRDMPAEEAHQRGLLTRLAPESQVDEAVDSLVARLLEVPVGPVRSTKRQVSAAVSLDRTGQDDAARLIDAVESPGFREDFQRYLDKVRPGR